MKNDELLSRSFLTFLLIACFILLIASFSQIPSIHAEGEISNNTTIEVFQRSWIRGSLISSLAYDSKNSLIYFVGEAQNGNGFFGYYDINSDEKIDLRDTGNWTGTLSIVSTVYDADHRLAYIAGQSGLFGYYNISDNRTYDVTSSVGFSRQRPKEMNGATLDFSHMSMLSQNLFHIQHKNILYSRSFLLDIFFLVQDKA
jgi:hypothetical protein